MKSSFIALLAVAFYFFAGISAKAVPDSCLEMVNPDDGVNWSNRDSVRVDTCQDSQTFGQWYCKYGYAFGISYYLFTPKPLSMEDRKTWLDIDSQLATTRAGFEILEQKFGEYTIRRWERGGGDSIHLAHPSFVIDFNDYQLVDSAIYYVGKIDSVQGCQLDDYPYRLSVFINNNKLNKGKYQIYTNNNNMISLKLLNENAISNYILKIDILDIFGSSIYQTSINNVSVIEIDISNFISGVYFLRIDNEVMKFIKY